MIDLKTKLMRSIARASVRYRANTAGNNPDTADYMYFQTWLIIATVTLFAAYVALDNNFFAIMISTDKSYLSVLILIVFVAASCHVAWNIAAISGRIKAAGKLLNAKDEDGIAADPSPQSQRTVSRVSDSPARFIGNFVRDVRESLQASSSSGENKHILEIYADQLRSPVEIGWFIVDILIRLGLIGTIIGFILILHTLVGGPLPEASEIQDLLISMSGGMGTALFTTLAGLVTATLLGLQYMILGRSVETLVAALIRIDERTQS